jgi:hypothetical protein
VRVRRDRGGSYLPSFVAVSVTATLFGSISVSRLDQFGTLGVACAPVIVPLQQEPVAEARRRQEPVRIAEGRRESGTPDSAARVRTAGVEARGATA